MTDRETMEEEKFEQMLREAYSFSDEQLLEDMEKAEESLKESEFSGAEDRIFQKLMAREAAEKEATEKKATEKETAETRITEPAACETEQKKIVRFGKRKAVLMVALVAVFVGMLGLTATGKKNYFFRFGPKDKGIVVDNGKNFREVGDLDEAYSIVAEKLDIEIMKMRYLPEKMEFSELIVEDNIAVFTFSYDDQRIHFIQEKRGKETSMDTNSDRERREISVYNKWIQKDICIKEEKMDSGEIGYSAMIIINNALYRLIGRIQEGEMIQIIKNLSFY